MTDTFALVVRWDRETGWAHLAVAAPGAERPRFTGFHRFADGDPVAVVAALVASGFAATTAPRADGDVVEVVVRPEVPAHAVR
ncbi:hypothetical protein [Actinophytocola sp. KF-1]